MFSAAGHLAPAYYMPSEVRINYRKQNGNGNAIHIGNVVSDMSGSFKKLWTPDISGEYTITATFMGSNSYGSSWAETAVGVVQAQATTTPQPSTQTAEAPIELYFAISTIAIIVAVAIVGLILENDHKFGKKYKSTFPFFLVLVCIGRG